MLKNQLIDLKSDLYKLIETANKEVSDCNLDQNLDCKIPLAGKVVVIQNQTVNISVTNNVIQILQKIDGMIADIDKPSIAQGVFKQLFTLCMEKGIGFEDFKNAIAFEYLKFARGVEGSLAAAARKLDANRTTLIEFEKRMEK